MKGLKFGETKRCFNVAEFTDRYGQKCSLQKSSLATENAIWLGIDNTGPQLPGPSGKYSEDIEGGRMHLTQEQVKDQLLPALQHFAETGELPD